MDVILHVYDLTQGKLDCPLQINFTDVNEKLYKYGFGFFHTGVEVDGKGERQCNQSHRLEYWFFGHEFEFTGIVVLTPGFSRMGAMIKRLSINMGKTSIPRDQIATTMDSLTLSYRGNSYHPVHRNCNHFSAEFVKILLNKGLPGYVNRLAYLASWVLYFVSEQRLWWVANKLFGGPAANEAIEGEQIEVKTDAPPPQVNPILEYMKQMAQAPPHDQRELSTRLFMHANNGVVTMNDVIPANQTMSV